MKLNKIAAALVACAGVAFGQAHADCQKSYAFQVTSNGVQGAALCDAKATTFIDALQNFNLSNLSYTSTSIATINGRFNDVTVNLAYNSSSTTLSYNFVELGTAGSFTGTTRKESQQMLEDYIKKNGIIGRIMNYQAQHSATSPITGAGGLIPMAIATDFSGAFNSSPTSVGGAAANGAANNNLIGVGLSYGSYSIDNSSDKVTTTSIPLTYTIRNDMDPRRQLTFSLPITLVEVGSAKTVHTGLGVSYRLPITDYWTLTPGARYSAVGSMDRATVSTLYSGSLTSTYVVPMSGFDLAIGNMLGYYRTGKFSSGDYSFDPDLKYVAMRNGLMLSQPVNFGKKMSVEYSLIDTRYLGDKPFIDNFQEIGITIGTNKSALDARSFVRGGLTYMHGPSTHGFTANIGYWF